MASILLIDDDPLVRDSLELQLSLAGHRVTAVADGADGLQAWGAGHFDVVVTDILMPGIEGVETVRRLRRLDAGIVIVAMTGAGGRRPGIRTTGKARSARDPGVRDLPVPGYTASEYPAPDYLSMVERLGATATLRKPFAGSTLLALIDRLLSARPENAADPRTTPSSPEDGVPE